MLLSHGIKYISENQLFLGMFFFSLFWACLVNIAGTKLLTSMGKTEIKASFVITIGLSICFSLFAVFTTYGVLGSYNSWDYLFPSMVTLVAPIIFEAYFVVLGATRKNIEEN
ncbi:hypothetical protein [Clostridium sp.]|uniref:hypothetical protein n=1 Tax=Clostridium sp. TaxID=1506 RepID=UPI003993F5B2